MLTVTEEQARESVNEGMQLNAFPPGEGEKGLEGKKHSDEIEEGCLLLLGRERGRNREQEEVERRRTVGLAGPSRVESIFNFGLK